MGFVWVEDKEDDAKFKKHIKTEMKALTNSNQGLKTDIVKLKKKVKEKEGIVIEDYNKLKTENEELKTGKQKDETEQQKADRITMEQLKADNESLKKDVEVLNKSDKKNLVDAQINKNLSKIGVKSSLFDAAFKIIKADVAIVEEDGKRKAVVGDRSIKDHVKWWSDTEEGKNFVVAKKNKGGNSHGSDKDKKKVGAAKYFDPASKHFNRTEQIKIKLTNPELAQKLADKYK